jgi:predicted transcriptional regulator
MGDDNSVKLAARVVSAFVSRNAIPAGELGSLFGAVYGAFAGLLKREEEAEPSHAPIPAVPVRKSVHPDYLICLEDGKKFKSLKLHLWTLGLTPERYRTKWNLPVDYPMVAANYSAKRSALAKERGFGRAATAKSKRRRPGK